MRLARPAAALALTLGLGLPFVLPVPTAAQQPPDAALAREVERAFSRQRDLRRVTVSATDGEVTLSGQVASLWFKQDAIKRALDVAGVETVVSEIEVPRAENDRLLAQQVGRAMSQYPQYSVFDYVTGRLQDGVVTLTGSVTADGRKANDIAEEVSRVRGVQDIRNEILTLPPSAEDDRIRVTIYRALLSNIHLEQFARGGRPPFHIVVHNSTVSLYGVVPGEIEYREFEMIARQTSGVLRVHNHLQTSMPRP